MSSTISEMKALTSRSNQIILSCSSLSEEPAMILDLLFNDNCKNYHVVTGQAKTEHFLNLYLSYSIMRI